MVRPLFGLYRFLILWKNQTLSQEIYRNSEIYIYKEIPMVDSHADVSSRVPSPRSLLWKCSSVCDWSSFLNRCFSRRS